MSNCPKLLTFTILLHIYGSQIFCYLNKKNIYTCLRSALRSLIKYSSGNIMYHYMELTFKQG